MNNIDLFNIYAGKVLAQCFAHFPVPLTIEHAAIILEMRPLTNAPLDSDPDWKKHMEVCSLTVTWLHETGYLVHRGEGPYSFVLAPKALEALNANLEAQGPKQTLGQKLGPHTLGQKLTEATKDVADEANSKPIGEIVGQIIGMTFRTLTTSSKGHQQ